MRVSRAEIFEVGLQVKKSTIVIWCISKFFCVEMKRQEKLIT